MKVVLFVVLFWVTSYQLWAIEPKNNFYLASNLSFTRFVVSQNFGMEFDKKAYKFGVYLGFNPERLIRFEHWSPQSKVHLSGYLLDNEKLSISVGGDIQAALRNYPDNKELNILSLFGGYHLSYGGRLQFLQTLSLGTSYFKAESTPSFWVHDIQFMIGIRYRLAL